MREISDRYGDAEIFATCRTHYADLLVWRGEWQEAEDALTSACRDLAGVPRKVVDGLVRLAELRRRQGRTDQAEALLAQAEGHRAVFLVRAALALDRGDARSAQDEVGRYLRRVGPADRFDRVPALELAVRAALALDDEAGAGEAAGELDEVAASVGTAPLRAAALLARGRVAAGSDPDAACAALEDAVDFFDADGAPYEAAHARLELAGALRRLRRGAEASRVDAEARAGARRARLTGAGARGRRGLSADGARARGAATCRRRSLERHDRRATLSERADGRAPRREHLRQDRRVGPHRPCGCDCVGDRPRRRLMREDP